ncbi:MAG: transposase [Candidatus Latescibacteria bacterium]|nr:transposase [Candidatus Latescibacterota bacterium]NIO56567.1 transposase [Candidatus Latescibacterota bacterium]NIT39040.1 transposase [Candidatus Latescibacterota bacterium]
MDRYIGLDAHSSSCTMAIVGHNGKRLQSQVIETNAQALINFLLTIPGNRHLCIEEGTHANWLYEVLSPHVGEIVVARVRESRGPKSDQIDAFDLAEKLRIGAIKTRIYKKRATFGRLAELSRAYTVLVNDTVRVKNRLKCLYRSRGVSVGGTGVYAPATREEWVRELPVKVRFRAELLYQQCDGLSKLRQVAEKEMLGEARKHAIYHILKTCPGMGRIRTAQMLPIVVTPYRFTNKRSFWAYSGLAVVMRSSSDWVRTQYGDWVRAPVQQTRGLNRTCNRTLKAIFKGAATTVIGCAKAEPLYNHYMQLLESGTKPNLAKLTIARQIASIILSMWRSREVYDPRKLKRNT